MGVPINAPNSEYLLRTAGIDTPATGITPLHWYSGAMEAVPKGITGAVAAMGRAVNVAAQTRGKFGGGSIGSAAGFAPMAAGADPLGSNLYQGVEPDEFDKALTSLHEWSKLDPRATGFAPQIVSSTTRGLTILFMGSMLGGPIGGASLLGGVEGYNDYRDTRAAGVDEGTALAKAGLTAVTAGLGALVPLKVSGKTAMSLMGLGMQAEVAGNTALAKTLYSAARAAATAVTLPGRLATGAVVNVGFGASNRYATAQLLDSAGYKEMAAQYAALDERAILADAVLGLAFGAHGHISERMATAKKAEARAAKDSWYSRPTQDMVEDALDVRRQEMISRGAAGVPTDPVTARLDGELQDTAVAALVRGRLPEVTPEEAAHLTERTVVDPQRVELNQAWVEANKAVLGDLADFSEPVRIEVEPPSAPVKAEPAAMRMPQIGEETGAKISPMAQEQLTQIAASHPDLEVTLDDGRTVRASEMPEVLAESLARASKDGSLFEAAVACFLRTTL